MGANHGVQKVTRVLQPKRRHPFRDGAAFEDWRVVRGSYSPLPRTRRTSATVVASFLGKARCGSVYAWFSEPFHIVVRSQRPTPHSKISTGSPLAFHSLLTLVALFEIIITLRFVS